MRRALFVIAILTAAVAAASQLTVQEILAAHRAGANEQGMVALVQGAESVAPVTMSDIAMLRAAGVPETVIQALAARAPQPTPTPSPSEPEDARLTNVVRLVKSGLSQELIAEQIRRSGEQYALSVNDLIYLKENQIPEAVIQALMTSGGKSPMGTTTAPAKPGMGVTQAGTPQTEFEGLVFKKGGVFAKNRTGKLLLESDKLYWRDAENSGENFELFIKGTKQLKVTCLAGEAEPFCYGITFDFTKGDDYNFEDAQKDVGGNENLMLLVNSLKVLYPKLAVIEKVKK